MLRIRQIVSRTEPEASSKMKRFEHILVNLSLTSADLPLLSLASHVANLANCHSITFVYAREAIEIPSQLKTEYPWLAQPISEAARERAHMLVEEHFESSPSCRAAIAIKEGSPVQAVLEMSLEENADLVLCGDNDIDRALAVKLARKAPCSILLVPERNSGAYQKVCAGVDFSSFSDYVLDVAIAFAQAQGASIDLVSCYALPRGMHKTSLPDEMLRTDLENFTKDRLNAFLEGKDCKGVPLRAMAIPSPVPGLKLIETAEKQGADLIIAGSRGKDALTAGLLGSNVEDLLRGSKKAAVLAVKEKGTGRNFLESLLGINASRSLF